MNGRVLRASCTGGGPMGEQENQEDVDVFMTRYTYNGIQLLSAIKDRV